MLKKYSWVLSGEIWSRKSLLKPIKNLFLDKTSSMPVVGHAYWKGITPAFADDSLQSRKLAGFSFHHPVIPHSSKELHLQGLTWTWWAGIAYQGPWAKYRKETWVYLNFVLLRSVSILGLSTLCKYFLGNGHVTITYRRLMLTECFIFSKSLKNINDCYTVPTTQNVKQNQSS